MPLAPVAVGRSINTVVGREISQEGDQGAKAMVGLVVPGWGRGLPLPLALNFKGGMWMPLYDDLLRELDDLQDKLLEVGDSL